MPSSNSTVDLDTLLPTFTDDSERVASNTSCSSNKADGQCLLSTDNLLSSDEALELGRLEARVAIGLKAFWEIGQALSQIRDKRLYREKYKTFEEYCITRWEMSRRSAYQLISAATVVENVRNCAHFLPVNEAQARPLAALSTEQQREAWTQAVATAPNGKVTAVHVAQVVKQYQQQKVPVKSNKTNYLNHQIQSASNYAQSVVRSCWNCSHCSQELLDDPQCFYCCQFGKLSFVEEDGNQRGEKCEFWTDRRAYLDETKKTRVSLPETFTLTLQLPVHLQPLIQDAAKESGLVLVDWVAKVLEEVIFAQSCYPK